MAYLTDEDQDQDELLRRQQQQQQTIAEKPLVTASDSLSSAINKPVAYGPISPSPAAGAKVPSTTAPTAGTIGDIQPYQPKSMGLNSGTGMPDMPSQEVSKPLPQSMTIGSLSLPPKQPTVQESGAAFNKEFQNAPASVKQPAGRAEYDAERDAISNGPGSQAERDAQLAQYDLDHQRGNAVSARPGPVGTLQRVGLTALGATNIGDALETIGRFGPVGARARLSTAQGEVSNESENALREAQAANLSRGTGKTPEELTIHDLMTGNNGQPKVNPDTKQPYTYLEAFGAVKNAADTKNAPKASIDSMIADATAKAQAAGVTDLANDPTIKALQAVKAGDTKPNQAEENKIKFQNLASQIAAQGLPTAPNTLSASIAKANLKPEDKAFMAGYMATNPNPTTTYNIGAEKTAATNANKTFTFTDEEGTHMVKGDRVPEGVDAVPVKDTEALITEAHTANIIQKSLNQIAQDVKDHPEIFDNGAARAIIATTTEQIDRQSAGLLVAGTGGNVPLPSGLGDMINTALQNNALDEKTGEAVRQYIADYKSIKDKVITMQMEMQGGKIGRGNAQAFKAIADQIPGGGTPDSKTAQRQLRNLFQTQQELMKKYPEKYGNFTKEKPLFRVEEVQ